MKNRSTNRFLIYFLLAVFPGILAVPSATAAYKYLQEGMKAPAIEGKDILTGEKISSESYLNEQNILISVFWATWSERSIEELKALKEISANIGDQPFKIIGVNVDGQVLTAADRSHIISLVTELDLPFPNIIDDGLKIFYEFGVIAVPSTAIFDTTGILRYGPAGFSLTTRTLIIDSIEVLLGIKKLSVTTIVKTGYQATNKASRYYNLALSLARKKSYERALTNLEESVLADTNFAAPRNLRAEIYLDMDSISLAIEEYKAAVTLDSTFVAAWAGFGRTLLQNQQLDEALVSLKTALSLDESFTPALLDLGLCLTQQGNIPEALDFIRQAVELNPMDPSIHYYLGLIHLQNNDTSSAAESFQTALKILYPAR